MRENSLPGIGTRGGAVLWSRAAWNMTYSRKAVLRQVQGLCEFKCASYVQGKGQGGSVVSLLHIFNPLLISGQSGSIIVKIRFAP